MFCFFLQNSTFELPGVMIACDHASKKKYAELVMVWRECVGYGRGDRCVIYPGRLVLCGLGNFVGG